MTPLRLFCIFICFLLASVPWFYVGGSASTDQGLPDWALHAFVVMLLFAVFNIYALRNYWASMVGDEDDSQTELLEREKEE